MGWLTRFASGLGFEDVAKVASDANPGGHGDPPLRPTLCRGGPPWPPAFADPTIFRFCSCSALRKWTRFFASFLEMTVVFEDLSMIETQR